MGSCASQALLDLFITGFIRSVPIPAGNVPLFEVKSLACPKVPGTPFVSDGDFAWIKDYLRQPIRKELPTIVQKRRIHCTFEIAEKIVLRPDLRMANSASRSLTARYDAN